MTEATALSAIMKTTVGIYVTKQTPGNDFSDVASSSRVWWFFKIWTAWPITALLFGLCYSLKMRYPLQLRYTFEGFKRF
ncbi:hypothetical protein FQN60_011572 [Etheostoma spectabile]|uniref:Uncharacterized protein n=1 Tax=Etheostoma spectabile TaxID=54343 RepID=A0A5J5DM06_9PERO|nr:hypothetical protein FQN60_011572 [Etheostoma spectabile]